MKWLDRYLERQSERKQRFQKCLKEREKRFDIDFLSELDGEDFGHGDIPLIINILAKEIIELKKQIKIKEE